MAYPEKRDGKFTGTEGYHYDDEHMPDGDYVFQIYWFGNRGVTLNQWLVPGTERDEPKKHKGLRGHSTLKHTMRYDTKGC